MYALQPTEDYSRRLRKWPKKHRRELLAMLHNFDAVVEALNGGARVANLQFGFLHHEPKNVKAVDQKGGGSGLKESRMYFFIEEGKELVHLLTIGDKRSQPEDISNCTRFVESLYHGQ